MSEGFVSRAFRGRRQEGDVAGRLPPGQYLERGFPVLSAGPTPRAGTRTWELKVTTETGQVHTWDWAAFRALPAEDITADLHCVTKWSKLATHWQGVSVDVLLREVTTSARFAMAHCYGGYTTNLPLADLMDGKAWVAFSYDGAPL